MSSFGALNVHIMVTTVASILLFIMWTFTKTVATAIGFVVIFGIVSGSVIALPPASMAWILGADPHAQAKLGQWTGMMYSGSAVFGLTGPVIAGYLVGKYDTYLTVQMWTGACLLLSAMCMCVARYYIHSHGHYTGHLEMTYSSGAPTLSGTRDDQEIKEAV